MTEETPYEPHDSLLVGRWRAEFDSWIGQGIQGYLETLDQIYTRRVSFARFGDGEMLLAAKRDFSLAFQDNSEDLRRELNSVLLNGQPNLLVGMSPFWRNEHWDKVFVEVWPHMREVVPQQPTEYGAAYVTRAAAFWEQKEKLVQAWRKIWDKREIIIVSGKRSRFELVPELFDNVRGVELLESEPVNAFKDVPRLVEQLRAQQDKLVLISLGAAATVLSAKLSGYGVQALDIGHISNCYNNVFKGQPTPEKLPRIRPLK